jgi:MYXO-CTERM domain-containing protein
LRASASLFVLALLALGAVPASAQSVIPIVELTVSPVEQFVNVTTSPVEAAFDCTVFVEGLPMVRYRVNLTAYCEGWETRCDPAQFTVTGSANNSFKAHVTVPAGTSSAMQHQVEISANVSTTGLPLNGTTAYSLLSVWPVFGLKLTTNTTALSVDAGKMASWPMTAENTGNGRDYLGTTVVNAASFPGWVIKSSRATITIEANGTYPLWYNITPPSDAVNQTIILQIRVFSRNAAFKNLTVEQRLDLEISVKAVAQGGGATNPPPKKNTPGFEAGAVALALAFAALAALRRRK